MYARVRECFVFFFFAYEKHKKFHRLSDKIYATLSNHSTGFRQKSSFVGHITLHRIIADKNNKLKSQLHSIYVDV